MDFLREIRRVGVHLRDFVSKFSVADCVPYPFLEVFEDDVKSY